MTVDNQQQDFHDKLLNLSQVPRSFKIFLADFSSFSIGVYWW